MHFIICDVSHEMIDDDSDNNEDVENNESDNEDVESNEPESEDGESNELYSENEDNDYSIDINIANNHINIEINNSNTLLQNIFGNLIRL